MNQQQRVVTLGTGTSLSRDSHRNKALSLAKISKWEDALAQCHAALKLNHEDWDMHVLQGDLLSYLERSEQAVSSYQKALSARPDMLMLNHKIALAHWRLGNVKEADKHYNCILKRDPNFVQTYTDDFQVQRQLGDFYFRKNEWSNAIHAYQNAIGTRQNALWENINLGRALSYRGDLDDAIATLKKAIDIKPEAPLPYYYLAEILANANRVEDAIQVCYDSPEVEGNYDERIQTKLQSLKATCRLETVRTLARLHIERTTVEDSKSQLEVNSRVEDYIADVEHKYKSAQKLFNIEEIERFIKKSGEYNSMHLALGDLYLFRSCLPDAIACYKSAMQWQLEDLSVIEQRLAWAHNRQARVARAFFQQEATPASYAVWIKENAPSPQEVERWPYQVQQFAYKPTISILVPTYNTPEDVLREMIDSVIDQVYPYWELCIADDCSTDPKVLEVLEDYANNDERIKIVVRTENGHISAASNSALTVASGEYVGLLDHDDELTPHALYEVVRLLNEHPNADMIYSDEDKRGMDGRLLSAYFKPDWSPDAFMSRMYSCHFGVYRRTIFEQIGGFRVGYEGSQDYDLVLRFSEQTNNIFHIPKILYHWRIIATSVASGHSAKPYAYDAGTRALTDAMHRRGEPGRIEMHPDIPGNYIPRYNLKEYGLVSIIIPTRNLGDVLDRCLTSIFGKSTYPKYEIIIIDNGSDESESLDVLKSWKKRRPSQLKIYTLDIPFNYSKLNNFAVSKANGEYLLFLNNDTEVITSYWIEGMVEQAQRSTIGAVGTKLLYPDDTLQHGGVILGVGGVGNHVHRGIHKTAYGYFSQAITVNNYSAVTAACLMCRREVFEQVEGFDENLEVAFNDIDLCLRIGAAGHHNIWLPHIQLYHHESKSRGYEDSGEKVQRLMKEDAYVRNRWEGIIKNDPYYNPNLTRENVDYSLSLKTVGEVLDVSVSIADSSLITGGWIDSPSPGICKNSIRIAGWVLGSDVSPLKVHVVKANADTQIHSANIDKLRPDVTVAFASSHNVWEDCGFDFEVDISDVSGADKLRLDVELGQERSCTTLGFITLRKSHTNTSKGDS